MADRNAAEQALESARGDIGDLEAALAIAAAAYQPDDPGGTLEGAAGREAAQAIDDYANNADEDGPDGFAGGFRRSRISDALQGSATYTGSAGGRWATRAVGSHLVDHGSFTATAVLQANFDGPGGAVSGAIVNFTDVAGRKDMIGWRVDLLDDALVTTAEGGTPPLERGHPALERIPRRGVRHSPRPPAH